MGIQDRDYYRSEGPSFLGSLVERGLVCKWLIGINIVCFLLQLFTRVSTAPPDFPYPELFRGYRSLFTDALILNVPDVLHGQVWRLLTCAFLHDTGSIWHILFNMLVLWWFGPDVEERRGPREFLVFYLLSAVTASVAYCLGYVLELNRGQALGASGAVMAVLVLSAFYNPRRIIYLFFVLPVPIWLFALFLVAQDTLNLFGHTENNIGSAAHLGGAAFALLYHKLHWHLTGWWTGWPWGRLFRRRPEPRLRLYQAEDEDATPTPVPVPSGAEDEDLEAQMDAILEKISRVGKENLTESEKQILIRASEAIRRKRS
jgi:membrane associated rhomboid family serine protease